MSILPNVNPTMLDLAKVLDPDGSIAMVTEILNQTQEGLDEMTWQEGNLVTGHRHTIRTGLPSVVWGKLYKGVPASTSTEAQVTDNTAFLESRSDVDTRLVKLAPDPMGFRAMKDRPHVEAMSQTAFRTIFKGLRTDPEQFVGLEERFSAPDAANGDNIIDTSTTTGDDIVSIWLIGWSPRTVFGIVPRGSRVGLTQEDKGRRDAFDANGDWYEVFRTYWRWDLGLAVPDWRYVVRAQVRASQLEDDPVDGGINIPFLMHDMIERMPTDAWSTTRPAFYTHRSIITKMRKQLATSVKGSTLSLESVGAVGDGLTPRKKFYFDGIPINRVDVLQPGETAVHS